MAQPDPTQHESTGLHSAAASSGAALLPRLRTALFWLSFLLLNLALFLPAFVLNSGSAAFLPPLASDPREAARQLLMWRANLDPFRLSAELLLLTAAWALIPALRSGRGRRPFQIVFAATFALALAYNIYESLSIFLYRKDPVIYNQAQLIVEGLPFLARHLTPSPRLALAGAAAALLALGVFALLLRALLAERQALSLGFLSRAALIALLGLVLGSFIFNGAALSGPKSVVSCLGCKIVHNAATSLATARRVDALNEAEFDRVYDYGEHALLARPDIYLIFVESYGSILYRRGYLRTPYLKLLDELEGRLAAEGWHAASAFSESPTWGGGSWMAYTSALFGLRIDTHPAYLALLERFPDGGFPHLGATLHKLGYTNGRVTAIAVDLQEAEWQRYKAFFGVDRWLQYGDLDYNGRHYGWGPAPPDQFVLSAANEELQEGDQPLFLFMITQNSHYPWQEVPPLVEDWRALNDGSEPNPARRITTEKVTVSSDDYLAAIDYELRFLSRFVREEVPADAVVILIGDHQPGYITADFDGYDTPLHILSRDPALLESFTRFGFEPGLQISASEAIMRHEGLYSLLMHALLARYGRGDRLPPPFYPQGISLDLTADEGSS